MNAEPGNINQLTEHLFRRESGKMLSVLVRIFGTAHLQLAEDVVQDTLLQALETWKLRGIPDNPAAWLHRAARNKAIDQLRRGRHQIQFDHTDEERPLLESGYTMGPVMDSYWNELTMEDDLLRMMYVCCHKDLPAESQITLMLKTLCGFSIAETARALLTTEDAINKRLYRTREFFRQNRIRPSFPPPAALSVNTAPVLRSIYLLFNEGYAPTHGSELMRREVMNEAIYLCSMLCRNEHTQQPEAFAALALMQFHAARADSRTDDNGDVILLQDQDRATWNQQLIREGIHNLELSAGGDTISRYHVEAAIAYEHCKATKFADTNWQRILALYDMLVLISPTAIVHLNRMAVYRQVHGDEQTLAQIRLSPYIKEWEGNYLYHCLLAEIHFASAPQTAIDCFQRALAIVKQPAERRYITEKMATIQNV